MDGQASASDVEDVVAAPSAPEQKGCEPGRYRADVDNLPWEPVPPKSPKDPSRAPDEV